MSPPQSKPSGPKCYPSPNTCNNSPNTLSRLPLPNPPPTPTHRFSPHPPPTCPPLNQPPSLSPPQHPMTPALNHGPWSGPSHTLRKGSEGIVFKMGQIICPFRGRQQTTRPQHQKNNAWAHNGIPEGSPGCMYINAYNNKENLVKWVRIEGHEDLANSSSPDESPLATRPANLALYYRQRQSSRSASAAIPTPRTAIPHLQ